MNALSSKRTEGLANRPLLNVRDKSEIVRAIIADRLSLYSNAADITVSTESKTPEQVARLILDENDNAV